MQPTIARRAQARQDLIECAVYLGVEAGDDLAARFLEAAESCFQLLAATPFLGWPRNSSDPALVGIRTWRVEGFEKHLIFYLPQENGVVILRVLHGARDVPTFLRLVTPEG